MGVLQTGALLYGPLAHLVEHLTLNQGVRGSSPRRPTTGGLRTLSSKVFGSFSFSPPPPVILLDLRQYVIFFKSFLH